MLKYLNIIEKSSLFSGISAEDINAMLKCLLARTADFEKGQFVLLPGDAVAFGMVLTGSVAILREDCWGNRELLGRSVPGELFAEVYACVPDAEFGVSVLAQEDSVILFLDIHRVLSSCSSACGFHAALIRNLVSELAGKSLMLSEKLGHISRRSTRSKLLSYLSAEARKHGSPEFNIPFSRQQLADYLSVERSAMSAELGRMRADGLIAFRKNHFVLL